MSDNTMVVLMTILIMCCALATCGNPDLVDALRTNVEKCQ